MKKTSTLLRIGFGLFAVTAAGSASAGSITLPGLALPSGAPALPDVSLGGGGSATGLSLPNLGSLTGLLANSPLSGLTGALNASALTSALQGTPLSGLTGALDPSTLTSVLQGTPLAGALDPAVLTGLLASATGGSDPLTGLASSLPVFNILVNGAPTLPDLSAGLPSSFDLAVAGGLGGSDYLIKPTTITSAQIPSNVVIVATPPTLPSSLPSLSL